MEEKISDVLKKIKEDKESETSDIKLSKISEDYFKNEEGSKHIEDVLERWDIRNRQIFLGDIEDDSIAVAINNMIRFFNDVDEDLPIEKRKPILIYIDSGGGSLTATLTIADTILLSKTPVYTINMGCAYSGGLLVFVCGHKRYTYPSASFLFHEGSTSIGDIDAGKFRNYAGFYDTLILRIKEILLTHSNMTEEFYKEKYRDDYWFFAKEAVEKGFADEIITSLKI